MHRDIEPGEWQREPGPCGRRYRMVGNTIEYEAVVAIDGLQIPESQLADYTRRRAEAERAQKEAERNAPPPPPRRDCPFSSGMNTDCTREACALFLDGCTLTGIATRSESEGKQE